MYKHKNFFDGEIPVIELMDATVLDEYNGHIIIDSETQLSSRIIPVDDSKSEANVSIHHQLEQIRLRILMFAYCA